MSETFAEQQVREIRSEWDLKRNEPHGNLFDRIKEGDVTEATYHVLFRVEPNRRSGVVKLLEVELPKLFDSGSVELKRNILSFCVKLSLDLGSFLPAWRSRIVEPPMELAKRVKDLTKRLAEKDSDVAGALYSRLRDQFLTRVQAEGVGEPDDAARIVDLAMKGSLDAYVESMWGEYDASNLRRAAVAYFNNTTATTLGNDYAAFLDHALRVGVSSQTTNPVLIKLAWDADEGLWNDRIDAIILDEYERSVIKETLNASISDQDMMIRHLNTLVTTSVVEQNCRMLRDIFLITEGRDGHVNLQVSPDNYADADAMISQAIDVYEDLRRRLGGVPNIVIKLPATPGGKVAAKALVQRGIGVTMTLTFSLFQALELGEVLENGDVLVSNIALMNGRLAYPVRDQLSQAGVEGGVEAAQWAGVAVARKIYHRLYDATEAGGMALDPTRIRLLIASLRIYGDWLPDISEIWGVPSLTVFPNVRRAFDAHPREINGTAISAETPSGAIETMLLSEIFRQAWWNPDQGTGEPDTPLSLGQSDAAAVAAWAPVRQTLDQFIDVYKTMNQMIRARLEFLVENK